VYCPQCGRDFSRQEDQRFCAFCGGSLEQLHTSEEKASTDKIQSDHTEKDKLQGNFPSHDESKYCPWEDLENIGLLRGIFLTLKQSLFTPAKFFSGLPTKGGLLNPLLYGMIIGTIGGMAGYLAGMLVDTPFISTAKLSGLMAILVGLFLPLFVFIGIILGTILLHASLFLVGGSNENFEATFRIVSYASGPDLLNAVPVIGWMIALIWKLVVTILGVREVQRISTGRAAAAVLLPAILCCGITFMGALALVGVSTGLLGS